MRYWHEQAIFYHIYTFGLCGAPFRNDYGAPAHRLREVARWIPHIKALGCTAVLFSPVFQSATHGYDTTDYFQIDSRLGTNDDFAALVRALHEAGLKVVLDGVLNHCGRDFFAFRDLCDRKWDSPCRDWFAGVDFSRRSPLGDPFDYATWGGYYELAKFNHRNADLRAHLFAAVRRWVEEFGVDGLRLDAADCLEADFMRDLRGLCLGLKPDFWLMGEVLHGDYRRWANRDMLHSVTNYEAFKGLHSCHNDDNLFEMAYTLEREFSPESGLYRNVPLYNFADNHDVDRLASVLRDPAHLYTAYILLYTMPGLPSIYYGSEWGVRGVKENGSDQGIRPYIDLALPGGVAPDLPKTLSRLASIRLNSPALLYGSCRKRFIEYRRPFVFERAWTGGDGATERVIVAVNPAGHEAGVSLPGETGVWHDLLNGEVFTGESLRELGLYPHWGRILRAG